MACDARVRVVGGVFGEKVGEGQEKERKEKEEGWDDVQASPSPASITNKSAPTVTVSSSAERNSRIFPAKGAFTETSICTKRNEKGRGESEVSGKSKRALFLLLVDELTLSVSMVLLRGRGEACMRSTSWAQRKKCRGKRETHAISWS